MNELTIVSANVISGAGVVHLVIGHGIIAAGNKKMGFKVSALGAFLVAIGALLLESWPVFALNAVWLFMSLQGVRNIDRPEQKHIASLWDTGIKIVVPGVFIAGLILLLMGYTTMAAWGCTVIYLVGYYLLSHNVWSNNRYLLWTFLAYFLLVLHLLETKQYTVLANETLGALLSLSGLIKSIKSQNSATGVTAINE